MNNLMRGKKGYKGGIKGTKFSPLKASKKDTTQKVKKAPTGKKVKY